MTSLLKGLLENMAQVPGTRAVLIVEHQGVVLERCASEEINLETARTIAGAALRQWEAVGADLELGSPKSLLIECAPGPVAITPIDRHRALVVIGNDHCSIGRIRPDARRAEEAMARVERATDVPAQASAQPPVWLPEGSSRGNEPLRIIEVAPAEQPAEESTGEIVVSGVHTFRLATRLATAFTHLPGIRSSRLRAYTPGRTVFDVTLEDPAALSTIPITRLDDVQIEVVEQTARRLVLRIAHPVIAAPALSGPAAW